MNTERKFEWKEGVYGKFLKVDVYKVVEELETLEVQYGEVQPQEVVEIARSSESVMHSLFTWDDNIAAQKYRENEARLILRSIREIKIKIIRPEEKPQEVRCRVYVNPAPHTGTGYKSTFRITDKAERDSIIAQAKIELNAWMDRYSDLVEQFEQMFFDVRSEFVKQAKVNKNNSDYSNTTPKKDVLYE